MVIPIKQTDRKLPGRWLYFTFKYFKSFVKKEEAAKCAHNTRSRHLSLLRLRCLLLLLLLLAALNNALDCFFDFFKDGYTFTVRQIREIIAPTVVVLYGKRRQLQKRKTEICLKIELYMVT